MECTELKFQEQRYQTVKIPIVVVGNAQTEVDSRQKDDSLARLRK